MKRLSPRPGLTEQVYQTLLDEIADGRLAPGSHLVQENLAAALGVSRQPIQQALAMLKNEGLVQELGRRGLFVAPLDPATMQHHYEIRAALDGLAARLAARAAAGDRQRARDIEAGGRKCLADGRAALASGDIGRMVAADVGFHEFVYEASANPLIGETAAMHWRRMRRVMGEVLRHAEPPAAIWRQHAAILGAIVKGDTANAEAAAIEHVRSAARRLEAALARAAAPTTPPAITTADKVRARRTISTTGER